jgi:antitoxin (DNA-binding transcriptional repressor) of toxin-antitoxin stability system
MPSYSVAEARNNLSRLIDQALSGESVTITRHGQAVVELRAQPQSRKPIDARAFMAWFDARPGGLPSMTNDEIVALVRDVRNGGWDDAGNPS